jgi:hypothetical protein
MALPVAAQEDPNLTGRIPQPEPPGGPQDFGAFGSDVQDTWISATEFTGRLNNQTPLNYETLHYYTAPGAAAPVRYFAQIPLPSGAQITEIACWVHGSNTNGVALSFQKFAHNQSTNVPEVGFIRSFGSPAVAAYSQPTLAVAAADGAVRYSVANFTYLYYIAADIAADTSLRGCRVRWHRTVSPAPAVATFPNDVPTTHGFFRFVEAMAASGLTGGCGTGSFCPDTPVTRGQLAVFLDVALRLHFPE